MVTMSDVSAICWHVSADGAHVKQSRFGGFSNTAALFVKAGALSLGAAVHF